MTIIIIKDVYTIYFTTLSKIEYLNLEQMK